MKMTESLFKVKSMDLYEIADQASLADEKWVLAQDTYLQQKSLLETIEKELFLFNREGNSIAVAEALCRTDKRYIEHRNKLNISETKAKGWKITYDKWLNFFQAKTMEISVSKHERKLV